MSRIYHECPFCGDITEDEMYHTCEGKEKARARMQRREQLRTQCVTYVRSLCELEAFQDGYIGDVIRELDAIEKEGV